MTPLLYRALRVQPGELPALAWAFAYFFLLLCSYYILRPVRDALAVEVGAQALQWLFTATFVAMLALVPVFGWLCARLPRATLLPLVYGFFALNIFLFAFYMNAIVFFVWLSVFNLFAVSVFWSFMSDIFDTPQAARLYGAIAAGGSCGAIAGPLLAAFLSGTFQHSGLLLLAAALLALTIPCIAMLARWAKAHPRSGDTPPEAPLGGSILAGVRAALGSRFLLAICGYLLCYTALSTALYFQQVAIVKEAVPDMNERTRLFASVDLVVNSLTLVLQILAFSRLTAVLTPGWLLAVVPLISVVGFIWLGATPTLAALITFGVARRVGEFAVSKPAREALFTVVPREERYKAKNFIDTVVYRGGDAASGWVFGALGSAIAVAAAALSVAWTAIAFYLGARMKSWTRDDVRSSPSLQPGR
ncbi:MAG TPA: MFS transporter [Burkholderiales bacterium]|nr:MFS transporter [Burkholderiales bacterium]